MSTEHLIAQLAVLDGGEPAQEAVEAARVLMDDSTVEASAEPKGIADAARVVGLATSTLRYYEREGLVTPARDAAGRRMYELAHLRRLVFCARMRASGMGMADLKRYIALVDDGEHTVAERRDIMLAHRAKIVARQRELDLALTVTDYKIEAYAGAPTP